MYYKIKLLLYLCYIIFLNDLFLLIWSTKLEILQEHSYKREIDYKKFNIVQPNFMVTYASIYNQIYHQQ